MQQQFREPHCDRGTTCLDAGVYLPNFRQCAKCGSTAPPVSSAPRVEEEDDDDECVEETEYEHRCADCGFGLRIFCCCTIRLLFFGLSPRIFRSAPRLYRLYNSLRADSGPGLGVRKMFPQLYRLPNSLRAGSGPGHGIRSLGSPLAMP